MVYHDIMNWQHTIFAKQGFTMVYHEIVSGGGGKLTMLAVLEECGRISIQGILT